MLEQTLISGFASLGLSLDEEALRRFRIYYEYLEETNRVMNLTAISGQQEVARLHFLDCAALLNAQHFSGRRVIDVGSGAGFPGLVLKIACPDIDLTLLDSLDKRVAFLSRLCERLGFEDVKCVHLRAEEAPEEYRQSYDFAVSRAVARLNLLSELCLPFVKKGGAFIAMKGPGCAGELEQARRGIAALGGSVERLWEYSIPGTDTEHCALIVRKTGSTPVAYPRRWAQMKKKPL